MRKLLALLVILTVAAGAFSATAVSASRTARLKDNFFTPKTLRAKRGDRVTWRWAGDRPHNVTVTSGPVRFASKTKRSGTYRRRVTRGGTYSIVCTIHSGMTMKLRVR